MATQTQAMIRACSLEELRKQKCVVVRGADRPIALFDDDGEVRAVDNRCPHMGFPLSRGSCKRGMITCHWHHARFDACSGSTFDLFADDVPAYDTEVRGGDVFVSPLPRGFDDPAAVRDRALRRLTEGMQMNIGLISAKAVLALRAGKVADTFTVREAALFGARNMDSWGPGLTILTAMANLAPSLGEETSYLALWHGVRRVAADCAGQAPRRPRRPLESDEIAPARLNEWLHHWARVRHRDGAERTLRTAIRAIAEPAALAEMIASAASQRFYADGGHLLDACNKALELLDLIGWEHADEVLPSLVPQLVSSRGGEESDAWYHPIDLVKLVREATAKLERAAKDGPGRAWHDEAALAAELLGDDPAAVLDAVVRATSGGATPERLGKALCFAAATRIARFGTANELGDWIGALHSFTYCNAVHQILKRCPSSNLLPAVLHGAITIYLNRFLNVPPAHLPGEREPIDDAPADAAELRDAFLELLDTQKQVGGAARVVARYARLGHPIEPLLDTFARAVVREDADFHTFQMLEAGVRQYGEWGDSPEGRVILIAMARYFAAHSPTQRGLQQTARIALRLHRGEDIYEEER